MNGLDSEILFLMDKREGVSTTFKIFYLDGDVVIYLKSEVQTTIVCYIFSKSSLAADLFKNDELHRSLKEEKVTRLTPGGISKKNSEPQMGIQPKTLIILVGCSSFTEALETQMAIKVIFGYM